MEDLKTIDLKMSWTAGLAYVRAGLEHGNEEGKRLANEYINDMAKLLDHRNEKLERALATSSSCESSGSAIGMTNCRPNCP